MIDSDFLSFPYAEVAVPRPVRGLFTYSVPEDMRAAAEPGRRALVPFGTRALIGLIVRRSKESAVEARPLAGIIDAEPVVDPKLLELGLWTAAHYFAAPGEILPMIIPRDDVRVDTIIRIKSGAGAPGGRAALAKRIFEALEQKGGERRLSLLASDLSMTPGALGAALSQPASRAIFDRVQISRAITPRGSGDGEESLHTAAKSVKFTAVQEEAIRRIEPDIASGRFKVTLIHGVTGSGKTEIYARLVDSALKLGKSALVLAPEIALAEAIAARFRKRLGIEPVILHSDIPFSQRNRRWEAIRSGEARLVVGARSAVFAPMRDLGLIVVDEEHDPSYKQEVSPFYNGRDVAVKRGSLLKIPVVLGSATPSLESYHHAVSGKYALAELAERIDARPMPRVEAVKPEKPGEIGTRLRAEIGERLGAGEQVLLFINRRGSARFIQCSVCGHVFECKNCSLSLVLHAPDRTLRCHTCGYAEPAPDTCPECGSEKLFMGGAGSEKVEREVSGMFPGARVARLDRDTASKRLSSSAILGGVEKGEVDILVGTQMITKGHDYPNITLVGAVSADDTLRLPDFRAGERTFQLVTQAAGRAGRGERPGLVIVQTLSEGHHSVAAAMRHDFKEFYEAEAPLRKAAWYPPFSRVAMIRISAATKKRGEDFVEKAGPMLARASAGRRGIDVLGPVEAVVFKTRNRFNWRALLKAESHAALSAVLNRFLADVESLGPAQRAGVRVAVDMDPAAVM